MADDDPGRYLTSLAGATHELFGGDPDEIVLRVAGVGERATTLAELARELRTEADRYERMAAGGWRLAESFSGGRARCRKDVDETAVSAAQTPGGRETPGPPARLAEAVEGAATLPGAASRLRAVAGHCDRLDAEGRRLARPVESGHIRLK